VLSRARRQARIPQIVHAHGHDVVTRLHRASNVESETCVAALVLADALAVHEQLGDLEHTVKLQVDTFARPAVRHVKMLKIPAITGVEAVCREIRHRERVRQVRVIPLGIIKRGSVRARNIAKLEFPLTIEVDAMAQT